MTKPEYIELHTSSAFSFLEAASQPEALIQAAVDVQMPSMALLDRNGFYGAPRFHSAAKAKGVRAHIGAEVATKGLGEVLQPPLWLPHQHTIAAGKAVPSLRVTHGLPKPLPVDHAFQDARASQG